MMGEGRGKVVMLGYDPIFIYNRVLFCTIRKKKKPKKN
jgi:hypothetical protein